MFLSQLPGQLAAEARKPLAALLPPRRRRFGRPDRRALALGKDADGRRPVAANRLVEMIEK